MPFVYAPSAGFVVGIELRDVVRITQAGPVTVGIVSIRRLQDAAFTDGRQAAQIVIGVCDVQHRLPARGQGEAYLVPSLGGIFVLDCLYSREKYHRTKAILFYTHPD